jgi:hypothetical protein
VKEIASLLLETLDSTLPWLREIREEEASRKPRPEKWSKKEVLGHLIDSASNNQHKFVRTMQAEQHLDFAGYTQDFWVESQQYNSQPWPQIINLWEHYNRHLAHVIAGTPGEKLNNTISINGSQPLTLRFIMEDYVEHLKHHLGGMRDEEG